MGHVEDNPLRLIKRPYVDERTVPVATERAVLDLLTLLDPALARTPAHRFRLDRNRAVLYLLWDTPGRRNEIPILGVADVDLDEGAVLVMSKGRKERWMPIGDLTRSVLWDYIRAREAIGPRSGALWVSEHGEAMKPGWLYLMLKRLGKRAGISGLHTHRFRYSYAMRSRMPERVLERVLEMIGGWRKIPDTYFRTLGAEDARQFHKQVSPGDRLGRASAARKSSRQRNQDRPRGGIDRWPILPSFGRWDKRPKQCSGATPTDGYPSPKVARLGKLYKDTTYSIDTKHSGVQGSGPGRTGPRPGVGSSPI